MYMSFPVKALLSINSCARVVFCIHIYGIYILYKALALTRTGHIQDSICIIRLIVHFHPRFRKVPAGALKELLHLRLAHWPAVFNRNQIRRFTLAVNGVFLDRLVRRHG